MRTFLQDLWYGLRQLRRHPVYASTAILSMALGIGATAAVYSVLYGVLVDPYPYRDAQHIAAIVTETKGDDKSNADFTLAEIETLRHTRAVTDIFASRYVGSKLLTGREFPESLHVLEGSGNMLQFLDAPPLLGRIFTAADAPPGVAPQPVAVVSYLFWKTHLGGQPGVIGSSLELNHLKYEIIGVMGPRFTWNDADVYLPLPAGIEAKTTFAVLVRLRPEVPMTAATSELEGVVRQIAKLHPEASLRGPFRVTVETLNDNLLGEFKGVLLTLFVAVALLLLIGCGNVSILLLARGATREFELSMRSALGASRARLVRQLLTESVLLSCAGGALGTMFAYGSLRLIVSLVPEYAIPHEVVLALNLPVLFFSVLVSVATGIVAGLVPALQLSRTNLAETVQASASRTLAVGGSRTRMILISGQIALTVLLMAASGAAMRNFAAAYRASLGFNPHNLLLMLLSLPEHGYETWQARVNYEDAMIEKIRSVPGVSYAATAVTGFPPENNWIQQVDLLGAESAGESRAVVSLVGAEYFSVMKIPLLKGRALTRAEVLRSAHFAVVTSMFAQRYFGGKEVIGRQVRPRELAQLATANHTPGGNEPYQIVGVAADVRNDGLHRPVQPQVYLPASALRHEGISIVVQTSRPPADLSRPISQALAQLDANQAVTRMYPFDEFLGVFVWARERFISTLFTFFSALALSLAAMGLISVIAFTVEQRTREIGIRSALGASRIHILQLVVRPTLWMTGAGLMTGLLLSISLSGIAYRWTKSSMANWLVLSVVAGLLLVVASVASLLTAQRAIGIDPADALRSE